MTQKRRPSFVVLPLCCVQQGLVLQTKHLSLGSNMVRRLDAVLEVRGGGGSSASAASSRRLPSTTPTEAHVAPKTAPKRTRRFLCYLLALTVMFALTPVVVVLAGLGDATCPSSVSSGPSTARGRALSMQALRRECAAAEILTAEGFPVVLKRKRSIFNNVLTPHNSSRASEPDGMRWGLAPDAPLLVFTTQMSMDRLPRLPRLLAAWEYVVGWLDFVSLSFLPPLTWLFLLSLCVCALF